MKVVCEIEKCTGCHACYSVCPVDSISMIEDQLGFYRPQINEDKCIGCKKCEGSCPANHALIGSIPQKTYAAITDDRKDYETSTSGGIATLISKECINNGGVVYGVSFDPKGEVACHTAVTSIAQLSRIKGSKYVQSKIGNSFREIKTDLLDKKKVVFVGTPCQVAGLKAFLKKEYDNLLCVDIVCHGVPSGRFLSQHLNSIQICDFNEITFREKHGFFFHLKKSGKTVYRKNYYRDIYYLGFMKSLFYQECCYSCKYATSERVGDITLGDFWGFNADKGAFPKNSDCGLSCVLLNTDKGIQAFDEVKNKATIVQRETEEAVSGNKQLRHPSKRHRNHDSFLQLYKKRGFTYAAKRSLIIDRIAYEILNRINR